MPDKPKHFDVRDSDDLHATEWTPEIEVMIRGFDRVFVAEAKRAAERAADAARRSDVPEVAGAAAAAILLSAAACEARLSEYVTEHSNSVGERTIKALRQEPDALKQWRLLLARLAPAHAVDASSPVGCLFKLRDLVAHRNARLMRLGDWPTKLKDCVAKNRIPVTKSKEIDWTSAIYNSKVAEWAYGTAADWLTTANSLGIRGIEGA